MKEKKNDSESGSETHLPEPDLNNQEFQNAWRLICHTNQSIFLTGRAGTGKSTFLRYIASHTAKKHVILAPTGIAAVNVGGQTLHSFFKIPLQPLLPDDPNFHRTRLLARLKYSSRLIKLIREIDLFIIDEISMVRADIIDFIDKILRTVTRNFRQPFGGKQMLFVGDIFQLEPVVKADAKELLSRCYYANFFFCANVFSELAPVSIELNKVYRQKDEYFINILDRIRANTPLDSDLAAINSRVTADKGINEQDASDSGAFTMTIATRRDTVDLINDSHLRLLTTPEIIFTAQISGNFPPQSFPTDQELHLKVGAQIVFVRNDLERRWVNGTLGIIRNIDENRVTVEIETGERFDVEPYSWDNIKYTYNEKTKSVEEEVLGSFLQLPLKLAWALTIHKSQGLTFNRIHIDMGNGAFSGGQSYVALSRCTGLEGITLSKPLNRRDIFVNRYITQFSKTFNDHKALEQALARAHADACYARAAQAFNESEFETALDSFFEAIADRNDLSKPNIARLVKLKLRELIHQQQEIKNLNSRIETDDSVFRQLADEQTRLADDCSDDCTVALAAYDRAITLYQNHPEAWLGKGLILAAMSDYDAAMEALFKASTLAPDDARPLMEMGLRALSSGDLGVALDALEQALARNPESWQVHSGLADIYKELGEDALMNKHLSLMKKYRKK
ncbi:MAG: AAA family ATPase [Muribaculaceae bacterium]|nr:AAA family ATPase [Muribaculaceae bacterium]